MATLALGLAGTAIGAGIGGGVTILGATLTAASIGGIVGSTIGGYVDSLIISALTPAVRNEGPRLQDVSVMRSSEGLPIGKLYGVMRISGNLIWATRFKETKATETETVGGKGGMGQKVENTTYTYTCSLAVNFGEGSERLQVNRLFMDGKEVDLSSLQHTVYTGTETQEPDSLIQSIEGVANTSAYRGTCYVVFEDLDLTDYGNRIPQITAEIMSPIVTDNADDLSNLGRSFVMGPGTGEFIYGANLYTLQNASNSVLNTHFGSGLFTSALGQELRVPSQDTGSVRSSFLNMHNQSGDSDFTRSLAQLAVFQPNLNAVVLTIPWFGDDLRADVCEIRPYAEDHTLSGVVTPKEWNVAGLTRDQAPAVSRGDVRPVMYKRPADWDVADYPAYGDAPGWVAVTSGANVEVGQGALSVKSFYIDAGASLPDGDLRELYYEVPMDISIGDVIEFSWSMVNLNTANGAADEAGIKVVTIDSGGTELEEVASDLITVLTETSYTLSLSATMAAAGVRIYLRGKDNPPYSPQNVIHVDFNHQSFELKKYSSPADTDLLNYGGTPSDDTIIEAIGLLQSQGLRVILKPIVLMDIPANNGLETPYSANAATVGQPAFPGRDKIVCSPATGFTGDVDQSSDASDQVDTFFDRTWGYTRMIEHYANISVEAGGADAILIGSNLKGLTQARSSSSYYPAVARLQALATAVQAIVGADGTLVSYEADWTEFHTHRPDDGSDDVYFNMDPLWEDGDIDFIAIQSFIPLSDWREGSSHEDYDESNGITTPHNLDYLKSNVEGGEFYDWEYTSEANRDAQVRTAITDAAYSKPWVYRQKDLSNWWSNTHYNRPGGVESVSATSYTPSTKPVWITSFGCPCVDKGANQPDAVYDPKSDESAFPRYSTELPDEYISRVYIEAFLQYWRDNSPVGMLDIDDMFIFNWDPRPFPEYPNLTGAWPDNGAWRYGHSLSGRVAYPALPRVVEELCERVGVTAYDTSRLNGAQALVRGYFIDNVSTVRDIIGALMTGFQFDAFESEGSLKFALKSTTSMTAVDLDDLVITDGDPIGFSLTRSQNSELPKRLSVDFIDAGNNYDVATLDAKRHHTTNAETPSIQLAMSLAPDYVRSLADSLLHQAWMARETGTMNLPPELFKLDPGDGISFELGGETTKVRLQSVDVGEFREASVQGFDPSLYSLPVYPAQVKANLPTQVPGFPELYVLDIPLYSGDEPAHWSPRLAGYASPWPGAMAIYRDEDANAATEDWVLERSLTLENVLGTLVDDVPVAPTSVWLRGQTITVSLLGGTLPSASSDLRVLNGANVCAMQNDTGHWEVFQYKTATLDGDGNYVLTGLIRGQLGTEWVMSEDAISAGNAFVLLENQFSVDPSTSPYLPLSMGDRGLTQFLRFGSAYKLLADDEAYLETSFTHEAMAKRPYSPVHLSAQWDLNPGSGTYEDISLSWIRRTRFGGDPWELANVPLNEEAEEYDLEILDGSTVVREVTGLTEPVYNYTEAMQSADFGSAQTNSIKIRVYQISAEVGRGTPAEKVITR